MDIISPLTRTVREKRAMRKRCAFTLLEMMLVMAVLIVLVSIAMPALRGPLKRHRLESAARQVRAAWADARVKAMKTGRVQAFYHQVGGTKYGVRSWISADDDLNASLAAYEEDETENLTEQFGDTNRTDLPDGVRFVASETEFNLRDEATTLLSTADDNPGERGGVEEFEDEQSQAALMVRPILFYPDGTSSDAFVILSGEQELRLVVRLRGLTGSSRTRVFEDTGRSLR